MTDTDILAFLKVRLDEDEQTAEAATAGPWTVADNRGYDDYKIEPDVAGPGYEGGGVWERADAAHISRHDPSRVLREVAAKRRLLGRHEGQHGCEDPLLAGGPFGSCRALRDLASVWMDHPDYDPSWSIDG